MYLKFSIDTYRITLCYEKTFIYTVFKFEFNTVFEFEFNAVFEFEFNTVFAFEFNTVYEFQFNTVLEIQFNMVDQWLHEKRPFIWYLNFNLMRLTNGCGRKSIFIELTL